MLNFYKTVENKMVPIDSIQDGCWINAVAPTEKEVTYLIESLGLDPDFVRAALDEEESSRIEVEENQTLVIVDVPISEKQEGTLVYSTMPMGIINSGKQVITICLKENPVVTELESGMVRNIQTHLRTQFVLNMLLRMAAKYLQCLKQIDKISHSVEKQLHKSMKNKELIQLLGLEKSLVYFSTSLKSNEVTIEKLLRGRAIKLYEDDQDLLEDVLVEVKQAIEMSNIYSSILSGTMDAFASIISNNLNIVMKVLASITIIMSIPSIISSFYGMNVSDIPLPGFWFPVVLSVVSMIIAAAVLIKKKLL